MLNKDINIDILNKNSQNSMSGYLGIEITEVGEDYICGKMPVDYRTMQPFGILHGGASVVLAETLGSIGSAYMVDQEKYRCVGLDINANHIRPIKEGYVYGKAVPVHIGRTTHIWEIKITNKEGKIVNISRLTMAVVSIDKI